MKTHPRIRRQIVSRIIFATCAAALAIVFASTSAFGASPFPVDVKMPLNFKDTEIVTLLENFAKLSQKTFVIDPAVRGRISLFTPAPVDLDEAFDLISTSLALNGYAVVEREGRYVVMASRNAQRSSIPTLTEITSLKPERYVTLIYSLKHMSASDANKRLRVLPSKDGEMMPLEETNQLVMTDYISNLNRIANLLKTLDQPVAPGVAKIVKEWKLQETKEAGERKRREAKNEHRPKPKPQPTLQEDGPQGVGP